ncbi:MAG: hypothetical protein KGP35_01680 [Bacteroidetes bacterium]|nr:hypothetical protein [Bacteroidota bacterium]
MKKPLRLFSFVFFLFAIYLNLFYKEDSFLARITARKKPAKTEAAAAKPDSANSTLKKNY